MLTGLIAPTSGDCSVHGFSILKNMKEIRKSLGICPQTNVLFKSLSVKEHLELYALLKGVKYADLDAEVSKKIAEVGLEDKRDIYSSALSGGMQRKLQCAMAFIGDSKVVFLDESVDMKQLLAAHRDESARSALRLLLFSASNRPTSGMDPYSRRSTWELLRNSKKDRVIVLTT
jgi:ATP-binding cassette subfamily A (ABC1) protein 3